jgi:hypothetical protein
VRIYDAVYLVAAALADTLTDVVVTLESGEDSIPLTVELTGTATITALAFPIAIGYGETIRATNGDVNAGSIVGTYVDVPAAGITLVRAALDATGVSVIPAAPTGYTAHFLQFGEADPTVVVSNLDAVTQSVEVLIDDVLVSRSAPILTLEVGALKGPTLVPVSSAALVLKLAAAVDTAAPIAVAAYELLPAA